MLGRKCGEENAGMKVRGWKCGDENAGMKMLGMKKAGDEKPGMKVKRWNIWGRSVTKPIFFSIFLPAYEKDIPKSPIEYVEVLFLYHCWILLD